MTAKNATLTSVPGLSVGQVETDDGHTGVTAVLFDAPASTVVEVRGGASGTYDTASLALDATFGRRLAVFFSGGSLYGLDAARGIRRRILEGGGGVTVFGHPTKIVPLSGAILFDLSKRPGAVPDYEELGYRAASSATRTPVRCGTVGAGAGATIGKYLGRNRASPGGVGTTAARLDGLGWVGVLAVVNAVGAVRNPESGRWVSGARDRSGRLVPPAARTGRRAQFERERGTTLVAIVTDASVERRVLQRIAVGAHDGLARVVDPVHTATDGDTVFVSSTGLGTPRREEIPGRLADRLSRLGSHLVVAAVLKAATPP